LSRLVEQVSGKLIDLLFSAQLMILYTIQLQQIYHTPNLIPHSP